ncbi:hypothetical protein ACPA9J_10060 [Pseudomonas aeruginosa]
MDEVLQGRSPYKPEVSYDMTKNPPQPILDSQTGNSPHGWILGWISKYWDEDPEHPPFSQERNDSQARRDHRSDPNRPPTQDNIKQVVEMKFPPDPLIGNNLGLCSDCRQQEQDYEMKPSDCDCGQENQRSRVPVEQVGRRHRRWGDVRLDPRPFPSPDDSRLLIREKPMEQPFDLAAELAKQPHLLRNSRQPVDEGRPRRLYRCSLCLRGTLTSRGPYPLWYESHYANASMSSSAWQSPPSPGSGVKSLHKESH